MNEWMNEWMNILLLLLLLSSSSSFFWATNGFLPGGSGILAFFHDLQFGTPITVNTVSTAAGYGLEVQRGQVSCPSRCNIFLLSMSSRPALVPTQPPIQLVPGVPYPKEKWSGCEADHLPPTNAKNKETWICTSNPHTSQGVVIS
jgi:hypothetical protein